MEERRTTELETAWSHTAQEILARLSVVPDSGLSPAEVRRRLRRFGPNLLRRVRVKSAWRILADQFKSIIFGLLLIAAVASLVFGQFVEAAAIAVVILLTATIGFVTETQAVRSVETLRKLGSVQAVVRRAGKATKIPADQIVPGDVVILEAGDSVSADLRLIQASKLQADESALTGESLPRSKQVGPLEATTVLADRTNMLYRGTFVTRGSGSGVVIATGMRTELGGISSLVEEAAAERLTPLERRLQRLGRELVWVTIAVAATVAILGIVRGKDLLLMIETAVALAVAAIPEGLPIVATIALARGMLRMARRHALIRRLGAVETLGATNVICTDKTGTLTENRMTVTRILVDGDDVDLGPAEPDQPERSGSRQDPLRELLEVGVLCGNAELGSSGDAGSGELESTDATGDPMEVALLIAGVRFGVHRPAIVKEWPEVEEVAFDPDVRMMATFHEGAGGYRVAVKGAPETILNACSRIRGASGVRPLETPEKEAWLERNDSLAGRGMRVLGLATKTVSSTNVPAYTALTFLGLAAMEDPPRSDVASSIERCRRAGIRVVMVTGDQLQTAEKIAEDIGLIGPAGHQTAVGSDLDQVEEKHPKDCQRLLKASVFARVSPKQKLDLIELHQRNGAIVAMTGDGVNDAPALEKADIGIAMGRRGTQVAREAADMVLEDDALGSVVVAVHQGRVIFGNIRKFVVYLLSCNVSEVGVVGLAAIFDAPLPILPLQILFLNLVTDVFPALALGAGRGSPAVMNHPPRDPGEPILTRAHWWTIIGYACTISAAVLGSLAAALLLFGLEERQAVTVSFLTLAFAQLWHVFNMRSVDSSLFQNDITKNVFIWGAIALCALLLVLGVQVPGLARVLQVQRLDPELWLFVLGMSSIPLLVGSISRPVMAFLRRDG